MVTAKLRFDSEQRFTCRGCARCCRRWTVAVTAGEVEAYRKAKATRWFRESGSDTEGAERDPFEPIPGHAGAFRIRRRSDGSCGFLSATNRCRIHEELGGDRKPLTCRLFPFRFHPAEREVLVAASFSCPTVVASTGATMGSQLSELNTLETQWSRQYPEPAATLLFTADHPIDARPAGDFRAILRQILNRPKADGSLDLRENVGRIAHYCEDLTRYRVLRLSADDFAEYMNLTGKYAGTNEKPLPARAPSRLSRILFRGFLFAVIALRLRLQEGEAKGLRLALRWRVFRVLAHVHGLGPSVGDVNLRAMRRAAISFDEPGTAALLYNYLRAGIENLGTGRLPLIDELGLAVALLNAACVLAAMQTVQSGATNVTADALAQGLLEAADFSHAEVSGSRFLSGLESLYWFASLHSTKEAGHD